MGEILGDMRRDVLWVMFWLYNRVFSPAGVKFSRFLQDNAMPAKLGRLRRAANGIVKNAVKHGKNAKAEGVRLMSGGRSAQGFGKKTSVKPAQAASKQSSKERHPNQEKHEAPAPKTGAAKKVTAENKSFSFGFGLERMGLYAIARPKLSGVLLLVFSIFCAFGLPKLTPLGALSELFRSETKIYQDYAAMGKLFPTSEYDTLIVIQGDEILSAEKLAQLRNLHLELSFAKGVDGVLSMFSMRTEPDAKGKSGPLFPDSLPKEALAFAQLRKKVMAHPLVGGRLLSEGALGEKDIALMVLSLKPEAVSETGFAPVLEDVKKIARDILTPDLFVRVEEKAGDEEATDGLKADPAEEPMATGDHNSKAAREGTADRKSGEKSSTNASPKKGSKRLANSQFSSTPLAAEGSLDGAEADAEFEEFDENEAGFEAPLKNLGLQAQFSGVPMMQHEIREAIRHDKLTFNVVGFIMGTIISFLFFRRASLVFIASVPPAIATLWVMGLLGHLGQHLNVLMSVIPPLIMVIAFSDAMHMVFSIRRRILDGMDRWEATKYAILKVGPACVLTSLTTAIALLSLSFADSAAIKSFAYTAAAGAALAFITVLIAVPVLAVLILKDEEAFREKERNRDQLMTGLDKVSLNFANWLTPKFKPFAVGGIILAVMFGFFHLQLTPKYALEDQVPDDQESLAASKQVDKQLTGAYPVHVMLNWSASGKKVESPEILNAIYETHRLMESMNQIGNVWSVETLRRWLEVRGITSTKVLRDYMDKMPSHVYQRFVNDKGFAALVTGRIPNMGADETTPVLDLLKENLKVIEAQNPNIKFTVTGLASVSATQSSHMITQLNNGFLSAVVIVIVFIGLAFRSVKMAGLSILPNLFPIAAIGTYLYLTGDGLRYASVLALTVAFGLAVDDTIHFLNRYAIERKKSPEIIEAIRQTIARIGPVLILTTMVLVCGLSVTILSSLSVTRLFGELSMATLTAALVADLLILPAIIIAFAKLPGFKDWWPKGGAPRHASA